MTANKVNLLFSFLPICIFSFFIAYFSVKSFIKFLKRRRLVDRPDDRTNHAGFIPRGAGLVLIPIFLVTAFVLLHQFGVKLLLAHWIFLLAVAILFTVNGIEDFMPRKEIKVVVRFSLQATSAILASLSVYLLSRHYNTMNFNIFGINFHSSGILLFLLFTAAAIGILWFTNMYNFMDGIDEITSLNSISHYCGLLLITSYYSSMSPETANWIRSLCFAGLAISGAFFVHNRHPARIFLGDSGSTVFGLVIGYIISCAAVTFSILTPLLLLMAYYLADSLTTLIKRIRNKQDIFSAHSEHFYQQAVRSGFSHNIISRTIFKENMVYIFLILAYISIHHWVIRLAIIAIIIASTINLMKKFSQGQNSQ